MVGRLLPWMPGLMTLGPACVKFSNSSSLPKLPNDWRELVELTELVERLLVWFSGSNSCDLEWECFRKTDIVCAVALIVIT